MEKTTVERWSPTLIFLRKTNLFNKICIKRLIAPTEDTIVPKNLASNTKEKTNISSSATINESSVPAAKQNKLL